MKKILISCILASSLLLSNSFGQLGLGYSKGDNADNFITAFGSLNLLGNIGLRLEYTKNMTENPDFSKEDLSRYGVYATYTLPLIGGFSLTPKIGFNKTDSAFTVFETFEKVSDSSTDFTYGLEANYAFNEKMSLFVGYTDYGNKLKINHVDTSNLDTANYTFGIKLDF